MFFFSQEYARNVNAKASFTSFPTMLRFSRIIREILYSKIIMKNLQVGHKNKIAVYDRKLFMQKLKDAATKKTQIFYKK